MRSAAGLDNTQFAESVHMEEELNHDGLSTQFSIPTKGVLDTV
jgi:hypothetical protein